MRTLLLIGIGPGDPDQITVEAIKALNRVDVFFVADKGPATHDLVDFRRQICEHYIERSGYRFVEVPDPVRNRTAEQYRSAVEDWSGQRADAYEELLRSELDEDGCGAFLVWGDPAIYDATMRVIEQIAARGRIRFEYEVIPGISSFQALAAKHRVPLNRIGRPIHITTGRLLADGIEEHDDVVVMLDAQSAFRRASTGTDIYWGAYLGTPDEVLVSGDVAEVADEIEAVRARERVRKGWIMDTYLLRRTQD